jgi:hypothetical protein
LNFNTTSTLPDWNQTVQEAVTNYGDAVSVWEIWNEPTAPNATCGYFNGTAQQYFDVMSTAYQIIKTEYPNATVFGLGGLPLYSGEDETYLNQSIVFAQQVVELGGMNYCDAISLHAYPFGHYTNEVANVYKSSITIYRNMTGKDVWITETGQESDDNGTFTQQEQADYLNASYTLFNSLNVKAYFWYELNDNNTGNSAADSNSSTFGLYDVNSNPKIVLQTYSELIENIASPQPQITMKNPTQASAFRTSKQQARV